MTENGERRKGERKNPFPVQSRFYLDCFIPAGRIKPPIEKMVKTKKFTVFLIFIWYLKKFVYICAVKFCKFFA